jgi:hypothetical protein
MAVEHCHSAVFFQPSVVLAHIGGLIPGQLH